MDYFTEDELQGFFGVSKVISSTIIERNTFLVVKFVQIVPLMLVSYCSLKSVIL